MFSAEICVLSFPSDMESVMSSYTQVSAITSDLRYSTIHYLHPLFYTGVW